MGKAINDAENRFQVLISLSIFFPILLYYLSKVAGSTEVDAGTMLLRISTLIGATLIDYLIFQGHKNNLSEKSAVRMMRDFCPDNGKTSDRFGTKHSVKNL